MADKIHNMKLLANDRLFEHGNVGEGMAIQLAKDGRRILWLAHESAPKNVTAVDVTDPRKPKVIFQNELPHRKMRSNSVDVCGDLMAIAYQVAEPGLKPAGIELLDISTPENPKVVGFFDTSGPYSRGVHQLWFCDGEYIHCTSGAPDWQPRNFKDDQWWQMIDVRDPSKPRLASRWYLPGVMEGDAEEPPHRSPLIFDHGHRIHNTNIYPERPDRAYLGLMNSGAVILDIADLSNPKVVGRWNPSPPYPGHTHTVMPLFDRDLLIVAHESTFDNGADWPKLVFVVDARMESNLVPISTLPLPPVENYRTQGGRYGAHNLHENRPGPSFRSSELIFGTYFAGGLRVHDISNPFQPKEVAVFEPEAPAGQPVGSIQINDVYVDENEIVYAVDRMKGGLYTLELTI